MRIVFSRVDSAAALTDDTAVMMIDDVSGVCATLTLKQAVQVYDVCRSACDDFKAFFVFNSVLSMTDKYNDYYDNELAKRFA